MVTTILEEAIGTLKPLAERWNNTEEWHNPPFLDGEIRISTADLRAIAAVVELHESYDQLDHGLIESSIRSNELLREQLKRWSSLAERAVAAHTVGDDGVNFEAELEELKALR